MISGMDSAFLTERITKTKALIVAYEDALAALIGANAVQSYSLDTGQTKQTVTRANIKDLQDTVDKLYNRLCILEQRLNGGSTYVARGAW